MDVKTRASQVIEEIKNQHIRNAAVVTHGGVIMVLLSAYLGMVMEKRFRFEPPANSSISTLVFDPADGRIKVESVNDRSHLDISDEDF